MEIKVNLDKLRNKKLFVATPCYGGNASGMYAKSLADLTAMCAQYGIQIQLYLMFNESLITRARNYCADEFIRSDATHLLFIDSDIGFNSQDVLALLALSSDETKPYDVIAGAYPKKSEAYHTKILTEDGEKTIGWIVDNKYSGKVKSFNPKTGKFSWNNIINWFKSVSDPNKRWVNVGRSGLEYNTMTDDHEVYVTDSVFDINIYKTEAKNITGKYIIRNPVNSGKKSISSLYSKDQISFLIGTLLGDGSINNKGYLKFGHSDKQLEYLNLKQKLFGGKISKLRKTGSYKKVDTDI